MSVLGTCPACGETGPMEMFLADAQARTALAAALRLPSELADLIIPYMVLHAPPAAPGAKRRRLDVGKLARLLDELCALVGTGQVTRHRDSRAAPLPAWVEGLRAVLAMRDGGSLSLPLSGHGLLCEIVYRQAASVRADRAAVPLHPSHLPAADPVRDDGQPPAPGPSRLKPLPRAGGGLAHAAALLAGLRPRPTTED